MPNIFKFCCAPPSYHAVEPVNNCFRVLALNSSRNSKHKARNMLLQGGQDKCIGLSRFLHAFIGCNVNDVLCCFNNILFSGYAYQFVPFHPDARQYGSRINSDNKGPVISNSIIEGSCFDKSTFFQFGQSMEFASRCCVGGLKAWPANFFLNDS